MGFVQQELVTWRHEKAFGGIHLELQQRAFVNIAGAVDADIAARFGEVIRRVILQPVGADDGVAPAEFRIALQHRIQIGASAGALAAQESGRAAAHGLRNLFLQARAGLQNQWRQIRPRRRSGWCRCLHLRVDLRGCAHRHSQRPCPQAIAQSDAGPGQYVEFNREQGEEDRAMGQSADWGL